MTAPSYPVPALLEWGNTGWMDRAACSSFYGGAEGAEDIFFPEKTGSDARNFAAQVIAAKAVCAECPVRRECLFFAVRNHIGYGVWGGKLPRERMHLRTARLGRAILQ